MGTAFLVPAGESRTGRPYNVLTSVFRVLLPAAETEGRCSIVHNVTQPGTGPARHRHSKDHEWFYILDGTFRFEVDGTTIDVGPGASVFAARGSAHAFMATGDKPGRMIIVTQPGGLDEYFSDLAQVTRGMTMPPDLSAVKPVFEKHGLEILGPPLAAS